MLLHKKGETGRLSQSYEDSDTCAIAAHYAGRRSSKAPRLSSAEQENLGVIPGKNIRFQLFPRSSRYAIPKFPVIRKQSASTIRTSLPPFEQAFLSPPTSPQSSFHSNKSRTLRGALGAIMPDLYFTGSTCTTHNDSHVSGGITTTNNGIINDELTTVEEILHKLHIRFMYEEHRNDLIVNIIEGKSIGIEKLQVCFDSSSISAYRAGRIGESLC